jgi:DNA-binding transcriptional LysR family regulator
MIDIKNKDLNLLNIFGVLMLERNVSRAAKRLNLSQSTISHSLGRMRDMFGDELFVRVPRGIVPTPKAIALAPKVESLLKSAQLLFDDGEAFDPKKAVGTVRLATTEFFEHIALPKLIPMLREKAPHVVLRSISTQGQLPKEKMEQGLIDIGVAGFFGDLPEGFSQELIFEDDFLGVARKGHPILKTKKTVHDYTSYDHILISPQGDLVGVVDKILGKKNPRRVVAGISNFLTPGWIVADSDLILTAPSRLVNVFTKSLPVQSFDLPFKSPQISVMQVWHERTANEPLFKWFRSLVKNCCAY